MDPGNHSSIHKRSSSPSPDARVPKRPKQSTIQQPPSIEHSAATTLAPGEDGGFGSLLMGHDELFGASEHALTDHGVGLTLPDGTTFFYSQDQGQIQAQIQADEQEHTFVQHHGVVVDPLLLAHSTEEASQGMESGNTVSFHQAHGPMMNLPPPPHPSHHDPQAHLYHTPQAPFPYHDPQAHPQGPPPPHHHHPHPQLQHPTQNTTHDGSASNMTATTSMTTADMNTANTTSNMTTTMTTMNGIVLDAPPLEFVIDESLFLQPDVTFGGMETSSVGLGIPPSTTDDEFTRRIDAMRAELARQAVSLPLLPESQVSALPPKPNPPAYHPVPKDASPEERARLTELNNNIALQEQTLDKMRNNQAAKKSRQTRVEALENTTAMLHDCVVEARWLRLKVIALGGDLADWDAVPREVREGIAGDMAARVRDVKEAADREKKRVERERRTLETRQRKRRLAEGLMGGGAETGAEAGPSTAAAGGEIKKESSVEGEEEEEEEEEEGEVRENGEAQGGDEPEDMNNIDGNFDNNNN